MSDEDAVQPLKRMPNVGFNQTAEEGYQDVHGCPVDDDSLVAYGLPNGIPMGAHMFRITPCFGEENGEGVFCALMKAPHLANH